eukprot:PhM_4_TR554/c0_g1_i1/m.21335/K21766/TBCC; tubulin-specific chaperone C
MSSSSHPSDASGPMPEVIQRMLAREEARKAAVAERKAATVNVEAVAATEAFCKDFYHHAKNVSALCTTKPDVEALDGEAGMGAWRRMGQLLEDSRGYLPECELTRANATLQDTLQQINVAKATSRSSTASGGKKLFSFKKAKTTTGIAPQQAPGTAVEATTTTSTATSSNTIHYTNNNDTVFADMQDTTIELPPPAKSALFFARLTNVVVRSVPIAGSIMVKECAGCTFYVAGRQLRIHDTTGTTFYSYTPSDPVIENCSGLKFGSYVAAYPMAEEEVARLGCLEVGFEGSYKNVLDFSWMKGGKSPHWEEI